MNAFQSLCDTLESSMFHSDIKKASAYTASALIILEIIVFGVAAYFFYDILDKSGNLKDAAEIAADSRLGLAFAVAGLILFAIVCILSFKMLNYLATKPLVQVDAFFKNLAMGQADWSEDMQDLPYRELKNVPKGYNTLMATIRNIIEDIRRSGIKIAIGSAHVLKAVEKAAHNTNQQKDLSEQVTVSSSDGNVAIKEISENAHYVSESTDGNLKKVHRSFSELETVARKVEEINHTVGSFGDTIDELNKNSAGIMDIIAVINDMSEQTNLLSLNATIEAARAGEHGKGFAVVAEEVRNLAKQIKPATEDISNKINNMITTVNKTKEESDTIIEASMDVNKIISETADNFKSMIGDFEDTNEQLLKIAAAIEELSLTNNEVNGKVGEINKLSLQVFDDMDASSKNVHELSSITEKMQEVVAQYQTGRGVLDRIIPIVRKHRDHIQETLESMSKKGINIFDENYKAVPNTNPQKFTTAYLDALRKELQTYLDNILKEIPGCVYSIPVDKKGYLPVHHSHVSKPMTGNYETDLLQSRHMRFFFATQCDKRRATSTAPMLFQTYMRDTGEVMNDLSMPITINGRHWGGLIVGLKPETLTQ